MLPESTFLDDGLKTKVKDTLIPSTLVAESKKVSKAEGASAKSGTSSRNAFNNGKAHAIEKKKRVGKPAAKTSDPQSKLVTAPLRKTEIPVSKVWFLESASDFFRKVKYPWACSHISTENVRTMLCRKRQPRQVSRQ